MSDSTQADFDEIRRLVSLSSLLIVNAIPLYGVLFWQWDVGAVIVLYWSENIVIGFYTLVKIICRSPVGGIPSGIFFLVHYGGFCAVHGLFVLLVTQETQPEGLLGDTSWPFFFVFVELLIDVILYVLAVAPTEWLIGFAALFISHGLSLWLNYFRAGEYKTQTVKSLMSAPYKRVVILHVAIIAGGFAVMAVGSPLPMLVLLVVLKTGLDLWLHQLERRRQSDDESPSEQASMGVTVA